MGGGGSMAAANQSLNANRKLVGKRKESRFSFVHSSKEKIEYNLPKATPDELKRIQEKFKHENKLRKQKRLVLISLFMLMLITVFVYIML